jgi:hypothetical protein
MALKSEHEAKAREVNDLRAFYGETLEPLRACCGDMARGFSRLDELVRRVGAARDIIPTRWYACKRVV